ncbi:MAG TPA: polyprenyl synthetase family protein, partial [Nitrospiria bacterium]|nr:polyprenyl synthetase family protein [Nitrospiria bacterium]
RALSKTISLEVHEINYTVSQACTSMLEGEILQFYHNGNINITEEEKDAISRFGLKLGTAFQVADDTLDYVADKEKLGKSMGKDLNEGKITLPLLHLLRHCDSSDKKKLMVMIETNSFEEKDLQYILSLMREHGSIDYSLGKAKYYIEEAKKELPVFEDSPHKKSLSILADYVATRDY